MHVYNNKQVWVKFCNLQKEDSAYMCLLEKQYDTQKKYYLRKFSSHMNLNRNTKKPKEQTLEIRFLESDNKSGLDNNDLR